MVDLSFLAEEPIPSMALVVGGLLSMAIAIYGHREDSHWDEIGTFFAFLLGAAMFVIAYAMWAEEAVDWLTLLLTVILALTLFLKPLREIPWASVIGVVVGGAAAAGIAILLPSKVFGVDEWVFWVATFIIVGSTVHFVFHFLEDLLTIARMVLDWKPTMIMVGLAAVAEGILLLMDRSILSFF